VPVPFTPPPLPSDDKRWKIVNGTMRKNGFARYALIETLHTVQSSFGYLDDDSIRFVANSLRVPLSQAYGVVTFYHYFSRPVSTPSPSAPAQPAISRAPTSS
jgi:bidirectional [NiFe] hydrogenase diaphorase subunit